MKTIKIKELNIEVEKEVHDFGVSYEDMKIPKGWRLLTINEIIFLYNHKRYNKLLSLSNPWEFIQHPFKKFKNKFASRFFANPVDAYFSCDRYPHYSRPGLGVRFCRDIGK